MRIIAGEWRGVPIAAPEGETTRPTIDRIRESLMSSLYYTLNTFDDVTVLDAFAGSGALGLEALSRGAKQAWFYELDPQSAATLEGNIKKLRWRIRPCRGTNLSGLSFWIRRMHLTPRLFSRFWKILMPQDVWLPTLRFPMNIHETPTWRLFSRVRV